MRRSLSLIGIWLALAACALAKDEQSIVLVVGAAGGEEYAGAFAEWAGHWETAAKAGGARLTTIGLAVTPLFFARRIDLS